MKKIILRVLVNICAPYLDKCQEFIMNHATLTKLFLIKLVTVIFLISSTQVLFADTLSDSDELFDWAEIQYPEFFSQPNQESESLGDYYYRYYPETNNYLGVNIVELDVYVLGDVFGGLVRIDSLSSLMVTAQLAASLPSIKLNDTGITWSGIYPDVNNTSCVGTEVDKQDCSYGRDAQAAAGTLTKTGAGDAGFDFTKLDKNGNSLPANAATWSCVRDNHTGLIWEVKTTGDGIHNKNNLYQWGGKTAQGSGYGAYYTDWNTLVDGSNSESLCGYTDWRVPNRHELLSIVHLGRGRNPLIDTTYFPNQDAYNVWSSSPVALISFNAWYVSFVYGHSNYAYRGSGGTVRLVRSGQ